MRTDQYYDDLIINILEKPDVAQLLDLGLYGDVLVYIMNQYEDDLLLYRFMNLLTSEGITLQEMLGQTPPAFRLNNIRLEERIIDSNQAQVHSMYKATMTDNQYYKLMAKVLVDPDSFFEPVAILYGADRWNKCCSLKVFLDKEQQILVDVIPIDEVFINKFAGSELHQLEDLDWYSIYEIKNLSYLQNLMQTMIYNYWKQYWDRIVIPNKTDDIDGYYD